MIRRCAVLLLFTSLAHAQEHHRVLVVPPELGGYFMERDQFRREVQLAQEERLRAGQFSVVKETLSPAESSCHEFTCLVGIAEGHGADLAVAGRIVNNQQVTVSYHLRVRVVDRSTGKLDKREREIDCDNCTEPQARDRLAQLMSAVIANEPEPKPNVTVPSPAPAQIQYRDRFSTGEKWALRGTGLAALAIGVGFLAQGFVELHFNGTLTDNGTRRIETGTTGQPLFFTLGGVMAAAGIAVTAVGFHEWKVQVAPAVSANGAGVSAAGKF